MFVTISNPKNSVTLDIEGDDSVQYICGYLAALEDKGVDLSTIKINYTD